MSTYKKSHALIQTRDWAYERAHWQAGKLRIACASATPLGTPKPPDHVNCGGGNCGCVCHAPTDAERALWRQIADEIDAFIERDQPDDVDGQLELTPSMKHASQPEESENI